MRVLPGGQVLPLDVLGSRPFACDAADLSHWSGARRTDEQRQCGSPPMRDSKQRYCDRRFARDICQMAVL